MSPRYPYAVARSLVAVGVAACLATVASLTIPAAVRATASTAPAQLDLPPPTGPRAVGTLAMHLVDPDRPGPDGPGSRPRELMVSLWYPAEHQPGAPASPYLPRRIAAFYDQSSAEVGIDRGAVDFVGARSHAQTRVRPDPRPGRWPVVLYSPGGGMPRMLATTLVEDLVGHGYVVVTLDHPGQAPIEYPDGGRSQDHDVTLTDALAARVGDVRFVLDTLAAVQAGDNPDAEGRPMPDGLAERLDLDRVGMFGHSLGGFATAETMLTDRRIDAGANLDGSMHAEVGRAAVVGVDRPFLLMGAGTEGDSQRPHHHGASADWAAFWAASTGWKRDIYFPDGEHQSFTDLQSVLPHLGAAVALDGPAVRAAIGTVEPAASLAAQRAYLRAFFDLHLTGVPQPLFAEPTTRPFPVAEEIG